MLIHLTLYSRSYCHLCDDMLAALHALKSEYKFEVNVVDVDTNEALVARYDELVPVLMGRTTKQESEVQLCHYFLDVDRVRAFLAGD